MLKIRMQRTGRINMPTFRIVVVEHTASPKAGNFVEKVGTYNPKSKERVLNAERIKYWMSVGAKPSDTVHNMLISLGVIEGEKINVLPAYKEPIKEGVVAETTPATGVSAEEKQEAASAPEESQPKASEHEAVAPAESSTEETAKAE